MQTKTSLIALLVGSILVNGCGGGGSSSQLPADQNITIDSAYQVEHLKNGKINIHIQNTPKDLYIVFTNTDTSNSTVSISHNAKKIAHSQKSLQKDTKSNIKKVPD